MIQAIIDLKSIKTGGYFDFCALGYAY